MQTLKDGTGVAHRAGQRRVALEAGKPTRNLVEQFRPELQEWGQGGGTGEKACPASWWDGRS